ncbi:MAG: thiamine pyrophosphate-binding protein, partial [Cellulosilyticaceae bacterium]
RHFQEMYFESNYYGTMRGYTTPDFVKIGEAYGITSKPITSYEEVAEIESLLLESQAYLFEIDLKPITYVIPKLSMGRPIEDQDPLIDREELQRHMIIKPLEEK